MDADLLYGVLLYGRTETRRELATRLAAEREWTLVRVLANTARQPGPPGLRARCLEVLGLLAVAADEHTLLELLEVLFGSPAASVVSVMGNTDLSPRQREIAGYVSRGLTNAEIAHQLDLSERTVENHISRTLARLGLHSRVQLAVYVQHHENVRGNQV